MRTSSPRARWRFRTQAIITITKNAERNYKRDIIIGYLEMPLLVYSNREWKVNVNWFKCQDLLCTNSKLSSLREGEKTKTGWWIWHRIALKHLLTTTLCMHEFPSLRWKSVRLWGPVPEALLSSWMCRTFSHLKVHPGFHQTITNSHIYSPLGI